MLVIGEREEEVTLLSVYSQQLAPGFCVRFLPAQIRYENF